MRLPSPVGLLQCPPEQRSVRALVYLTDLRAALESKKVSQDAIKEDHQTTEEALRQLWLNAPAPAIRHGIAECLPLLFIHGHTYQVHGVVGVFLDALRAKTNDQCSTDRLCMIECLGSLYGSPLGVKMGSNYVETIATLLRILKASTDPRLRVTTLRALLECIVGTNDTNPISHRDIHKAVKSLLSEKEAIVREAAALCLAELYRRSPRAGSAETEGALQLAVKIFDAPQNTRSSRRSGAQLLAAAILASQRLAGTGAEARGNVSNGAVGATDTTSHSAIAAAVQRHPADDGQGDGDEIADNSQRNKEFLTADEAMALLATAFVKGSNEVRLGLSLSWSLIFERAGPSWLQRNIGVIIVRLFEPLSNPKIYGALSMIVAHARSCLHFALSTALSTRWCVEAVRISAAKDLGRLITRLMATVTTSTVSQRSGVSTTTTAGASGSGSGGLDGSGGASSPPPQRALDIPMSPSATGIATEGANTGHILALALHVLADCITDLATAATPLYEAIIPAVMDSLRHPHAATRAVACHCMRAFVLSCPMRFADLAERCRGLLTDLWNLSFAPEASFDGMSLAVATLVSTIRASRYGLSESLHNALFAQAEEGLKAVGVLLSGSNENASLLDSAPLSTEARTAAAWTVLTSLMTLGPSYARSNVRRLFILWRDALPKGGARPVELTGGRGAYLSLLHRRGALTCICAFVKHCPTLLANDVTKRIVHSLNGGVAAANSATKNSVELRDLVTAVRLSAMDVYVLLPPQSFESFHIPLVKLIVADLTLNSGIADVASRWLLREQFHHTLDDASGDGRVDDIIDGSHTDLLEPEAWALGQIGDIECDPIALVIEPPTSPTAARELPRSSPLDIAAVESSVRLFSAIFSSLSNKHKRQLVEHLDCVVRKVRPGSPRQIAIQINVLTALLASLHHMREKKETFGSATAVEKTADFIMYCVISQDALVRCAAAEAAGRIAFVAQEAAADLLARRSLDALRTERDSNARAGHAVALGCIHRSVGSMVASRHLKQTMALLHALLGDSSTVVYTWALHSIWLLTGIGGASINASGGAGGSGLQNPSVQLMHRALLSETHNLHLDSNVAGCVGRLLNATAAALGPELAMDKEARFAMQCVAQEIESIWQPMDVRALAVRYVQQLVLFAASQSLPTHHISNALAGCEATSRTMRHACISLVKQFAQQQPQRLLDLGTNMEHVLFAAFGAAWPDPVDCENIREAISSLIVYNGPSAPSRWLRVCRDVMSGDGRDSVGGTGSMSADAINSSANGSGTNTNGAGVNGGNTSAANNGTVQSGAGGGSGGSGGGGGGGGGDEDDNATLAVSASSGLVAVTPAWPVRILAGKYLRRLLTECTAAPNRSAHFDLAIARDAGAGGKDFIALNLGDWIRVAFNAATSGLSELRVAGLQLLSDLVDMFAPARDPDVGENTPLLEQYQAQVMAALRPAFDTGTLPFVVSAAATACASWLCSGATQELRRAKQLLASLFESVSDGKDGDFAGFDKSATTEVRVAVLHSWARIFVAAKNRGPDGVTLLNLTNDLIGSLAKHWAQLVFDYAVLSLPEDMSPINSGGKLYAVGSELLVRRYFADVWLDVAGALSMLVDSEEHSSLFWTRTSSATTDDGSVMEESIDRSDDIRLLYGLLVRELLQGRDVTSINASLVALANLWCAPAFTVNGNHPPVDYSGLSTDEFVELASILRFLLFSYTDEVHVKLLRVLGRVCIDCHGLACSSLEERKVRTQAAAETCLRTLSVHVPGLLDSISPVPGSLPIPGDEIGNHEHLSALEVLPDVHSARVAVGGLELLAHLAQVSKSPELLSTALHCSLRLLRASTGDLATACLRSVRMCLAVEVSDDSLPVLQSALINVLLIIQAGVASDICNLLPVATLFAGHASIRIWDASARELFLASYQACLSTDDMNIKALVSKSILSLSQHTSGSVAAFFGFSLAPPVVVLVRSLINDDQLTETALHLITDGLHLLEVMTARALPDRQTDVILVLVSLLCAMFRSVEQQNANPLVKQMHNRALQTVLVIGPKYPAAFKASVALLSPAVKQRLETAVRENVAHEAKKVALSTPVQPTIKLKMDFASKY